MARVILIKSNGKYASYSQRDGYYLDVSDIGVEALLVLKQTGSNLTPKNMKRDIVEKYFIVDEVEVLSDDLYKEIKKAFMWLVRTERGLGNVPFPIKGVTYSSIENKEESDMIKAGEKYVGKDGIVVEMGVDYVSMPEDVVGVAKTWVLKNGSSTLEVFEKKPTNNEVQFAMLKNGVAQAQLIEEFRLKKIPKTQYVWCMTEGATEEECYVNDKKLTLSLGDAVRLESGADVVVGVIVRIDNSYEKRELPKVVGKCLCSMFNKSETK